MFNSCMLMIIQATGPSNLFNRWQLYLKDDSFKRWHLNMKYWQSLSLDFIFKLFSMDTPE